MLRKRNVSNKTRAHASRFSNARARFPLASLFFLLVFALLSVLSMYTSFIFAKIKILIKAPDNFITQICIYINNRKGKRNK